MHELLKVATVQVVEAFAPRQHFPSPMPAMVAHRVSQYLANSQAFLPAWSIMVAARGSQAQ
jgi:hypothetical protein